jgi:hypothetical protein
MCRIGRRPWDRVTVGPMRRMGSCGERTTGRLMDGAAAIVNGIGAWDRVDTNVNTFQNWNINTIHLCTKIPIWSRPKMPTAYLRV